MTGWSNSFLRTLYKETTSEASGLRHTCGTWWLLQHKLRNYNGEFISGWSGSTKCAQNIFFSFLNEGILREVIILNIRTLYKKYISIFERNKIRMTLSQPSGKGQRWSKGQTHRVGLICSRSWDPWPLTAVFCVFSWAEFLQSFLLFHCGRDWWEQYLSLSVLQRLTCFLLTVSRACGHPAVRKLIVT